MKPKYRIKHLSETNYRPQHRIFSIFWMDLIFPHEIYFSMEEALKEIERHKKRRKFKQIVHYVE